MNPDHFNGSDFFITFDVVLALTTKFNDMKKCFLIVAAMVAGLSLSAQQKGDMYVSGHLNLGLNSSTTALSSSSKFGNEKHTGFESSTVNVFKFGIAPKFGYFIADNLEVNVALKYNLGTTGSTGKEREDGNVEKDTPVAYSQHTFMVAPGLSYYLPIVADKLYYAPAFGIGLGLMANESKVGNATTSSDPVFGFGLYLDLAAFEYRLNGNMAVTANIGGLEYTLGTKSDSQSQNVLGTELKVNSTASTHTVDFGFSKVAVGFKYYF